jgi:DNA-binding MarR family transcriptional regulator
MPRKSRNDAPKAAPARSARRGPPLTEPSIVQDVVVRAMRLGDALASHMDKFFSQYGITTLQYNVMRILYMRDPQGDGLPSGSFAARLVRRVPDIPRLLDRLVKAGFLQRVRSADDRRVVLVRLTAEGVALVERVNNPLFEHDARLLADIPESKLPRLATDLQRALDSVLNHGHDVERDA